MDKVAIIIVTYNGMRWIEKCLSSVSRAYAIVVVDNASTDETVAYINSNYQQVTLLSQSTNKGFGAANNIGISYALKNGADYVFLLNQDAYLKSDTISNLIKVYKENRDFGILSPIHLNGKGSGLDFNFSNYILKNKELQFDALKQKFTKKIYEVPFVNAAAWLIPRGTFEIVGGFDPIFFHYGEDDNFCQRVLFHKIKIGVVPTSFINHDRDNGNKNNKQTENDLLNLKERSLKVKFANINMNGLETLNNRRNYLKRVILKLNIKLKFNNAKPFKTELQLINMMETEIKKSIKINKSIGKHYLNF